MRAQLSFVLSQIMRLTDRQTDRILIARPRLHSMQRGQNNTNRPTQEQLLAKHMNISKGRTDR